MLRRKYGLGIKEKNKEIRKTSPRLRKMTFNHELIWVTNATPLLRQEKRKKNEKKIRALEPESLALKF